MECPKCGYEQPQAEECISCGIVIRKYKQQSMGAGKARQLLPHELSSSEEAPTHKVPLKTYSIALLVIFFTASLGFNWWSNRPVSHGPGVIAPKSPMQSNSKAQPFTFKDYQVTPLADFYMIARVLSKKKYSFDRGSDLAPFDLALGWGRMSDETVLGKLKIRQSNRFYFWQTKDFPIPRNEIESHSANMHLIPANPGIKRQIKKVRVGEVAEFEGYLVKLTGRDNWHWKSSLSRGDTGDGSCEVVFVKDFRIKGH